MFNSLSGTVTGKFPQKLFLETGGIEWDISVPDSSLEKIAAVGSDTKVYVWLQHTDALMNLFGFASESERNLFFDLLKVDGIGPKGALKIMSNISPSELASVLDSGDIEKLQKVPGVGKKTAAKMLLQLKGKLTLSDENEGAARQTTVPFSDVIKALADMGYERKSCETVVSEIASELGNDGSFAQKTQAEKEDAIFRRALVEMAR
ncbi:MAG: Holliday junction branch migration protein RuvA [Treponema sp.]|nr:Holliday junction branch migration protein RuvA [Treponema sp.]